jgi:hypothetical protein
LDVVDLPPRIKHWTNTTNQTMGNWVSKEEISRELESIKIEKVPVYESEIQLKCNEKYWRVEKWW